MNNLVLLLIPLTLVVGGIAIWKGRGAERLGGIALIVTLAAQFGSMAILSALGVSLRSVVPVLDLLLSYYLATSLLIAALKFCSPWLGVACMIQSLEMAITAVYKQVAMGEFYSLYLALLNSMTLSIVLLLGAATARSIYLRRLGALSYHDVHGTRVLAEFNVLDVLRNMAPQRTDWPWALFFDIGRGRARARARGLRAGLIW